MLIGLLAFTTVSGMAGQASQAEWTVLIFMNADNDLEHDALWDFAEIARVGSTDGVNMLQFDRGGRVPTNSFWDETLRVRVTRGMLPTPEAALQNLGEVNMGSEEALRDFVEWGSRSFPAERTALIIWNHGQGWRSCRRSAPCGSFHTTIAHDFRPLPGSGI